MTQPVNPNQNDFIRDIIEEGLRENKHEGRVADLAQRTLAPGDAFAAKP